MMQNTVTEKPAGSRILRDWMAAGGAKAARNLAVVSSNSQGMNDLFAPIASASGYAVNETSAMRVSTVYACCTKLAGSVSQLPLEQYRLAADGTREQAARNALWYKNNESPADAWTAASWKEWIVKCVALRGDQFTEILRSRRASTYGDPIGYRIYHPDYVNVRRIGERLVYDVQDMFSPSAVRTVDQDDMLHFPGFGFDGMRSMSIIQFGAKNGIGNSLAAADYTGKSIGEGAMPQIALQFTNKLSADQQEMLRQSFVATYGSNGSAQNNSRRLPLVLTEGGTAHELSISPVDMQLLESRQFEREDICHAFGVPGVMIGDNTKTSSWGTGIEQITLGFVRFTIKPHLRRWQEELNRKLFRNAGPFVEFDLSELLKGDSKAQAADDRAALGGPGLGDGYKTVNEVRKSRNLAPVAGGDVPFKAEAKSSTTAPAEKTDEVTDETQ